MKLFIDSGLRGMPSVGIIKLTRRTSDPTICRASAVTVEFWPNRAECRASIYCVEAMYWARIFFRLTQLAVLCPRIGSWAPLTLQRHGKTVFSDDKSKQ